MSEATAIVLIHGLWLTSLSWERWIKRYEHLGYRVLATGRGWTRTSTR
jgi:pimeloyl-ACP methyl ester carboxylesterase